MTPADGEEAIRKASGFEYVFDVSDGEPGPAVVAHRSLLEAADGSDRFKRLLRTSRMPSQLYALCGLYVLEPKAFRAELQRLWDENPDTSVNVWHYESLMTFSVRDILGSPVPHPPDAADGGTSPRKGILDIASGEPCRKLAAALRP